MASVHPEPSNIEGFDSIESTQFAAAGNVDAPLSSKEILDGFEKQILGENILISYDKATSVFRSAMSGTGLLAGLTLASSMGSSGAGMAAVGQVFATVGIGGTVGWPLVGVTGAIALLALMVMLAKYQQARNAGLKDLITPGNIAGVVIFGVVQGGVQAIALPVLFSQPALIAGGIALINAAFEKGITSGTIKRHQENIKELQEKIAGGAQPEDLPGIEPRIELGDLTTPPPGNESPPPQEPQSDDTRTRII